ncbi:toxin glutamine deamidase domain-containing protein [Kitasatospora herbaricolor]|uniref:Toxin glutamine deamidase domain-containing protein n=1 Tax=Kitasatospora herbaricolor TaxID=68217 RepID=A0ABZ1WBF0_9ACTN|nr:toxin glutamine deamidase domain-containing protein [Kitasatospora herbaricolor]
MSRKLPEELAPVLALLGHAWPQADEDGLRRAAGLWREFATESERLGRRGGASAGRVTGENSGRAVEAFADHWQTFSGGGRGHLDDAQHAAELVAKAFETAARATDTCKAELVSTLTALAEDLKQAEEHAAAAKQTAAQVSTAATGSQHTQGVFGAVVHSVGAVAAKVKDAAADTVADAVRTVAVEAARLKVAGLLEELGRAMKAAVQSAMKEPALTALTRIAGAGTAHVGLADVPTMSEVLSAKGGFDPAAAGLPAALGEPGVLGAGGAGLTVRLDEQGKPVVGVEGLTVKLDENGRPALDEQGNPVILRADGTEVADPTGLTLVVGKDGRPVVAVEGLTVELDEHGRPQVGPDGRTVLNGPDGKPVVAVDLTQHAAPGGKPPFGTGLDAVPGSGLPGSELPGPGLPGSGPPGSGLPGGGAPGASPLVDVTAGGAGPDVRIRTGPVGAAAGPWDNGNGNGGGPSAGPAVDTPVSRPERPAPAGGSGHAGGGYGPVSAGGYAPSAPVEAPPAPSHGAGAPASVRTDSVLAPPAPDLDHGAGYGAGGPVAGGGHSTAGGPAGGGSGGSGTSGGYVPGGASSSGGGGYGVSGSLPGGGSFGSGGAFGGGGGAGGSAGGGGFVGGGPAAGAGHLPSSGGAQGGSGASGAGAAVVGVPGAGTPAAGGSGAGGSGGSGAGGSAAGAGGQPAEARQGAGTGGSRAGAGTTGPVPIGTGPILAPGPGRAGPEGGGGGAGAGTGAGHGVGEARRRGEHGPGEGTAPWVAPVATAQLLALHLASRAARGQGEEEPDQVVRVRCIADSRPYGVPGGLGPVDPQEQAELERRVPKGADGLPARHPDPAAGGWAEVVNAAGHREPGRANNALEIALSAVDTFTGRPACAAPRIPTEGGAGERGGRDRAERELGAPFRDLGEGAEAFERLAGALRRAGHGAQAVLLTLDAYGRSHAWNAVHHQEAVTYLDHQTGRQGPAPLHSADHGLWAIALDPDCRPLDLAERRARPAVPETVVVAEAPAVAEAPDAPAAAAGAEASSITGSGSPDSTDGSKSSTTNTSSSTDTNSTADTNSTTNTSSSTDTNSTADTSSSTDTNSTTSTRSAHS